MGRNFELDACLIGGAISPFTFPTRPLSGFRQKGVLRNFDQVTARIALVVSTQAFPAIAGIRVDIGIVWNPDGETLIARLDESIVAVPALAVGTVRQERIIWEFYFKTGVILPPEAMAALPAGAVAACLGIFRHRFPGLAECSGAEHRRKEQEYGCCQDLCPAKLSVHKFISNKPAPAPPGPKVRGKQVEGREERRWLRPSLRGFNFFGASTGRCGPERLPDLQAVDLEEVVP